MAARLFTVRGRVQGVWFRESTRRFAEPLGLAGHAINLPNGDVEVFAVGDERALDQLEAWLHEGPPMARVSELNVSDTTPTDTPTRFRTG